jgi:YidC/Oxa1 family membrane protein insertase
VRFLFETLVVLPLQHTLDFFYRLSAGIGYANYGLAIILLTLAIKLVLYPLTVKQVRAMKSMQEIQPKMKELQEKYKDKPEKMQQEVAALYKEAGVNPLSGCLPMIIQMPILWGIFWAIKSYQYAQIPSFLWLHDLSQPDPTYILPVLSALTTYISQKQTMATGAGNQQAKMMAIFMPCFIGYISIKFPGGLVLYWIMSNVFQIAQQWWMYRHTGSTVREAK